MRLAVRVSSVCSTLDAILPLLHSPNHTAMLTPSSISRADIEGPRRHNEQVSHGWSLTKAVGFPISQLCAFTKPGDSGSTVVKVLCYKSKVAASIPDVALEFFSLT